MVVVLQWREEFYITRKILVVVQALTIINWEGKVVFENTISNDNV